MIDPLIAEQEIEELTQAASTAIRAIIYSQDRLSKHDAYTWKDENEEEHVLKALRHLATHQILCGGYQRDDGDNHLHNAICRIAMALAKLRD